MGCILDNFEFVDTTSPDAPDLEELHPKGITEKDAQEYIISYLVGRNRFEYVDSKSINPRTGLDMGTFVRFVQETQPHVWDYFSQYGDPVRELEIMLVDVKNRRGTLSLVRDGVPGEGGRPAVTVMFNTSALNLEIQALWEQNIFCVYDEVKYETVDNPTKRIDLVVGVNGIPVQAVELKNELTGQSSAHAEEQFKLTRSNQEPLLRPVTGCITFFSMSRREVAMATVLRGVLTAFLPFNQGKEDGGKGNPPVDDRPECNGFRTHYMMEEIWTRECLTDVLFNFMFVDSDKDFSKMSVKDLEAVPVIFPRYHQVRLVRKTVEDLKAGGQGAFLVQHSAGSGKTLSIAWLTHQGVRLVDDDGKPSFDHAIVATDRVGVVRQLESTIRGINRHDGLVAEVKNTKDLAKAIAENKRIIVTTVQKFGHLKNIIEDVKDTSGKRFLVALDEAHSGQSGENAASLTEVLGTCLADELAAEGALLDVNNIVYVAFTATPRAETVAKFGSGNAAYDLYSMRQAIEEGQILNVLKNYVSHEIVNQIYNVGDDVELPSTIYAKRAMNNYIRGSKENLSYKVAVILENMVTNTLCNIGGLGRGMVVTGGREDVHKYFVEINKQIAEYPELYGAVKPVAAYTGYLMVDGKKVEDKDLNGFGDTEIPNRLSIENLDDPKMRNLLIVADKYQTGFDEPLLCSMYVDKKLRDIAAVQTLNRLNRIRMQGDKENVTVIDFQDNEDEVRKAFAKYGVEARVKTHATVADLQSSALALYAYGVFTKEQIDAYYKAYQSTKTDDTASTVMSNIINRALDNIEAYRDGSDRETLERFNNFQYEMRNFLEDFVFVTQFKEVTSANTKGLYIFLKLLVKLLKDVKAKTANPVDWLENIRVEIAQTIITSKNISSFQTEDPDKETGGNVGERGGASHLNPNDFDAPITVEQLVAEYNEKLKTLIFASVGLASEETGHYSQEQLDGYDLTILDDVVAAAAANPLLEEYSLNRSSQRFVSENTQTIIRDIILEVLIEDKKRNLDNGNYINLPRLYSDNNAFAEKLERYALSSVYQIFLRNRLAKRPSGPTE